MKKILGLAAGILLTVATYAQAGVTFTDAKDGYNKTTTQVFNFQFASTYSIEQINKNAAFYTSYFTVTPVASATGVDVSVKLVEDNEMARRVITRFFVSLEVEKVSVNGTDMPLADFMSTYVML